MNIELRHITRRFGALVANDDISLTFPSGRIIGVLGENGAGKSTLMKILSGYQPADSGDILLNGTLARFHGARDALAAGIGMLQQDPLDIGAFSVLENFMYGQPGGLLPDTASARTRLNQLSARFGFDLRHDMPTAYLSIAQRQQLEIVHLLLLGVRVLILDEPTTGISAEQKARLFDTLRTLSVHDDMTVLLVSHKLEDVIALCSDVVVLRAGRVAGKLSMPATTEQLVKMMFGEEHPAAPRVDYTPGDVLLSLENAALRGRRFMMERISLQARAGEVIGLAGLDGSGQELLMRACAGLLPLHGGTLRVRGALMNGKPYRDFMARGVVFSAAGRLEEGLIAGLTLTEHLALVTERAPLVNWKRARRYTAAQLEKYRVRGTPDSLIETLSGGNQQRTLLAMLPATPTALILEQPTRGLDVDSARWIWQHLLAQRANGAVIVFSSAELEEIVEYSDRVLVFHAGRVVEAPNPVSVAQLGNLIGGKDIP